MSEVFNVDSVKSPDKDIKVNNGTGKNGDGRDCSTTTATPKSVDRRARGEGFENWSKYSSRSDLAFREDRNNMYSGEDRNTYSGRDGYSRNKDKSTTVRRSSSRGGNPSSQTGGNNNVGAGGVTNNSNNMNMTNQGPRGRRSDDIDRRGNAVNNSRSGRRGEDMRLRPHQQGPTSSSVTNYEKKGDNKDMNKGYIEDPLTKLLKRVTRVGSERDRRLTSARQLKEYLHGPEVRAAKSSKQIFEAIDSLQNVLFERISKELKQEVAVCIGLLGSCLSGQDIHGFFEWVFSNVNSAETDAKVFLSMALLEMLKQDELPQRARDYIANVMANVHQMLEAAVTPNLLIVVLDIIIVIARVYPHVFSSCFREVTDIVIGWLIDPTQTMQLIDHMSASLVQLQAFWQSDIQFSVLLLGQFTEDLELMLEQDLNQAVNESTLETVTIKITAILRVFYTVVLSLGDSISTLRGGQITVDYLVELLNKLVTNLEPTVKMGNMEKITILSNDSVRLILHQLSAETAMSCGDIILPYIIYQTSSVRTSSNSVAVSMLRLLQKIVEVFSTQLPVYVLLQLLGPDSVLSLYRFSHCPQVLAELMAVYHSLMALKSVPLLEEAYRLVLSDITVCYNILLADGNQELLQLVAGDNPFKTVLYSSRQAQQAILFNIGALIEIANTKSNLIGMWALSPSIFTLLSRNLMITDPWMNKHQSQVVYCVLHSFYSHCNRHSSFMTSSVLISPQIDASRLATMSQANNQNFTEILRIIVTMLDSDNTSFDSRCLLMKWTSDIITSLVTTPHIYTSSPLSNFISTIIMQGYHKEQQIFQCAAQCLKSVFKMTSFPDPIVKKCMELCVYRLSDIRKPVRECFLSLLKILPVDKMLSMDLFEGEEEWMSSEKRSKEVGLTAAWHVRRTHMARAPLGNFHSHNFRHIMAFILSGIPPSQNGCFHWLEAMYHAKQRNGKSKSQPDVSVNLTDVISNESLLWFWATWECAQFAIVSRLRTPLGKAPETFMAIEGVIKAFAAESQSFSNLDDALERRDGVRGEKVGEYMCLQRVHLLMNFMEHLDKLLYNAYEGCAVAMPAVHKVVKTFFRTNRNTCQEWLSRIRMSLLTIAVHCGMWAMAVRQAFELLRDLDDAGNVQSPVFDQALVYLIQALCELCAPESIMGVYQWCKETTCRSMSWIQAAVEKAHKRYEKAATDFQGSLRSMLTDNSSNLDLPDELNPMLSPKGSPRKKDGMKLSNSGKSNSGSQSATISFVANQVTDCYMRLNDWTSVIEWQESLAQQQQLFHLQVEGNHGNIASSIRSNIDVNYIKSLSEFEVGNVEGVKQHLELVPGLSISDTSAQRPDGCGGFSSWDLKREEDQLHRMFVKASTQLLEQTETLHRADTVRCIQQTERLGDGLLRVCAMDWPPSLPQDGLTQLASIVALRKQLEDRQNKISLIPLSSTLDPGVEDDLRVYNQLLRTIHMQQRLLVCDKHSELAYQLSNLQLAAATAARKQMNTATAEDILLRQAATVIGTSTPPESVLSAIINIRSMTSAGSGMQKDLLKLQREWAKLLRTLGKQRSSLDVLAGSVLASSWPRDGSSSWTLDVASSQINSRSLLTLVKWLQADPKLLGSLTVQMSQLTHNNENSSPSTLATNLNSLLDMERLAVSLRQATLLEPGSSIADSPMLPDTEGVIGRLLHLGSMQSPSLAKAWSTLAGWCYKWGRKAVDNASSGCVELSVEEETQVLTILPKIMSEEEKEKVLSVLSQIHNLESSEEDIIDEDQSIYDDGTDTTRKQLLACSLSLSMAPDSCVDRLIVVWKGVVRRVYHYYQLSAKAYFTYLHVNGLSDNADNEGCTVISTLRLLRLLVKHASELREVLETGLSQTPTAPWKGIIPQLFSRLSHPENYVRQSISELLCRIALDTPHLIVYPAVVGSSSKIQVKIPGQNGFLKPFLSQDEGNDDSEIPCEEDADSVDDDVEESASPELQACLSSIVEALSKLNPQMIGELQLMVQELRRITLLWEELWLGTLNQHQTDVQRRLAQLDAEIKRVEANKSLSKAMKATVIREKNKTIMKPTLYTMERLYEITSQPPQTPQENWFQATYGKQISAALQRLREPSDPSNPHDTWSLFKCIHLSLQQRAQKRNSLQLKMDDISPKLAALTNSVIPMPGLTSAGKVITIMAVHNLTQILPTKTKPKKLIFIGSDGRRHPYLFKGLEDLHLDERIMQFLSIVNSMFTYHKRSSENRHQFRARHYSVTPLGPRSGLIQWVEGATALFSLYKKWQQREVIAQTLKSQNNSAHQQQIPNIPRPSEVFFNKLNPALKEKGIENTDNRKEWPQSILRKVLDELMDETPDDLLAKEMWCCSSSAGEWWQVTQSYARSTAVMSMIGYIIGLGDRHLDNVLVDLATGEVVHIDYNVCFEKGKGLRVPENVPFRLTANIETALGLTGVEGTFRISSEHVMKTMRKGRESLLTLLEAFVYDPLVDWTTGGDAGYTGAFYGGELAQGGALAGESRQTKQQMERDITTSMFSIRLTEMESSWSKNKSELMAGLPVLMTAVKEWMKTSDRLEESSSGMEELHTVQQSLVDAQSAPHHTVYTLSDRYSDYMVLKATRDKVMGSVREKINEFSNWHKIHIMSLEKLQSSTFQSLCAEVLSNLDLGPPSFAASSAFLQGAGQSQIISQILPVTPLLVRFSVSASAVNLGKVPFLKQVLHEKPFSQFRTLAACEQLESEVCSLLEHRRDLLHSVIKVLHTYSTIVSQFGVMFAEDNRTFRFHGWLQELLNNFTSRRCEEVISRYHDTYSLTQTYQLTKAQFVFGVEAKLHNLLNDTNSKLMKLMDRRSQETNETLLLEVQVQESDEAIKLFVYENGLEGEKSLMSVIVSALYTLNKRYLLMEGAAAGAGDRLMDLTSRDGDWFLDELCSMSGNVNQFLETLNRFTQMYELSHVKNLQHSLRATHNVFIALQDLNMNFRSIILPEALKLTQAQDEHFLSILSQLDAVINQSSMPLECLITQLELMHRNAIMGIEDKKPEILNEVKQLQQDFMDLLQNRSSGSSGSSSRLGSDQLTSGHMLLMGFSGLFSKLEADFAELLDSMQILDVPVVWKKVDTVREAKSMQLSTFSSTTRPLLSSLFFLKRLQAIQDFFYMASQFAAAIQGLNVGVVHDVEHMVKPIKKFIADFVRKQVLGFPSQVLGYLICVFLGELGVNVRAEIELKDIGAEWKVPLDALCKKGMETCLTTGQFQHRHLTQVTALTSNLDTAWRKLDLAKRLDNHIVLMKGQVQRCQPQLARFQWLHEDLFTQTGRHLSQMVPPGRSTVMLEMKKSVQSLLSQESSLSSCQERYSQMEASISQRLRWAAGANPSLNTVLSNFEKAASYRKKMIEEEGKRVTDSASLCQGILHLEALRTHTQEASSTDSNFLQLLNQCSECCMLLESTSSSVSALELRMLEIKPLGDGEKSDLTWIKKAVEAVDRTVADAKKSMEQIAHSLIDCQRDIKESVTMIKGLLSTHHRLMSDIRSILKTLAKIEEQDYGEEVQLGSIRAYLAHYKTFSEKITAVLKTVVSEMTTREEMSQSVIDLDDIRTQLDIVYDSLSEFAPSIISKYLTTEAELGDQGQAETNSKKTMEPLKAVLQLKDRDSPPLLNNNSPAGQSMTVKAQAKKEKEKVSRDPKTGKAVQERNSYAVGVWRRVKMKLEGRDPDPNKRMSVAEQVDYIIKEAKNPDNLAVLYEGWTPWV